MKKILILLLMFHCFAIFTNAQCSRETKFGSADLCLPFIKGYKECYLEPEVKFRADATEAKINMVLGFYLDDATYEKKDKLDSFSFDNYVKVYGTKEIQNFEAGFGDLKEMQELISGNFISKNWDTIQKEVDKIGLDMKVGIPTIVDSYNLDKSSFTYVMLIRYKLEGVEDFTMAMTMNGMLINKRMIWMAYYLKYDGEKTFVKLKKQSNKILSEILEAN